MNASSEQQIPEPLQLWLNSLPRSLPLHAVTASDMPCNDGKHVQQLIADASLPGNSLLVAMIWLRIGVIDPPHAIVQVSETPIASYLHGVVHRLEGDYWNSKYWFKQTQGDRQLETLFNAIRRRLQEESLWQSATDLKIVRERFEPCEFVSACQQLRQQAAIQENVVILERIGWVEWACLWEMISGEII